MFYCFWSILLPDVRPAAEIGKSVPVYKKSNVVVFQVLQRSSLYSSPFSVKYCTASAFETSFLYKRYSVLPAHAFSFPRQPGLLLLSYGRQGPYRNKTVIQWRTYPKLHAGKHAFNGFRHQVCWRMPERRFSICIIPCEQLQACIGVNRPWSILPVHFAKHFPRKPFTDNSATSIENARLKLSYWSIGNVILIIFLNFFIIPAPVVPGIVPCVASTSTIYQWASAAEKNNFADGIGTFMQNHFRWQKWQMIATSYRHWRFNFSSRFINW